MTPLEVGILGQRDPLRSQGAVPSLESGCVDGGREWGMEEHWSTLSGQGHVQAIWGGELGPQVQGLPITVTPGHPQHDFSVVPKPL